MLQNVLRQMKHWLEDPMHAPKFAAQAVDAESVDKVAHAAVGSLAGPTLSFEILG